MPIAPGTRFGPYEILSAAGAGGMGEVYRAKDTRLDRTVAVKVLPSELAHDPEKRRRFEREARSISTLSHPHICTLHDIGQQDGVDYLVLEYLEGQTLERKLEKGPLPVQDVLRYAIELADALDKAHRQGIIHRDIKPGNIMLTKSGVKLMDFGLAKLKSDPVPVADALTEMTADKRLTVEGAILGTYQYMAPEQLEGREVDARTDIFAFGEVLYEMVTGKRAFEGRSQILVASAILEKEPESITDVQPLAPPALDHVVRGCLEKDPESRWQSPGDIARELRWITASSSQGAAPPVRLRRMARERMAWGAVAAALLALLALSVARMARSAEASVPHLASVARLTHDPDYSQSPTWSPDGTMLAFSSNRSGNYEIYVRRVEGGQEVNVTNDPGQDIQPAFSPDGNWIAFVSTRSSRTGLIRAGSLFGAEFRTYGGDIWLVPALGGQARLLAQDGNYPAWNPGGSKVLYVSGRENHRALMEVTTDGGAPRALLPAESSSWEILKAAFSPSGRWITFETYERQMLIMPAGGGPPRGLLSGVSTHVWDPSGQRLYYCSPEFSGGTRLLSVDIDERAGKLNGEPKSAGLLTAILRDLAISADQHHVAATEMETSLNLTRLPLNASGDAPAGPEEMLSREQGVYDHAPAVSPDNKIVAYMSDRLGHQELWLLHLDTKRLERLQLPGHDRGEWAPEWFPDGRKLQVLRVSADGKGSSLWTVSADGSHAEELVTTADILKTNEGIPVSPDGRNVTYSAMSGGFYQFFNFDTATRQSKQLTFTPGDKYSGLWSPDRRWLAYSSNAGGAVNLWRIAANGGTPEQMTKGDDRVRHLFYSPDGRWLYFQPNHQNIFRMPATGGASRQVTHFSESALFIEEPTISPDGRYLYYSRSNGGSSLWLLTVGTGKPESETEK